MGPPSLGAECALSMELDYLSCRVAELNKDLFGVLTKQGSTLTDGGRRRRELRSRARLAQGTSDGVLCFDHDPVLAYLRMLYDFAAGQNRSAGHTLAVSRSSHSAAERVIKASCVS